MSTNCSICNSSMEGDDIHICTICGEFYCYACGGDERNYCGFCTREKEAREEDEDI